MSTLCGLLFCIELQLLKLNLYTASNDVSLCLAGPSRSAAGSDDEEPEISSEEEQQINSDVELSD